MVMALNRNNNSFIKRENKRMGERAYGKCSLPFFGVSLKNVFLNRHSCYYRIDNLNLRFAFLKFVISATIAVTILPNHLWIGRCRGQQFVVGSYNKKGRNLFCDRFVRLLQNCAHKRPIFTLFFFDSLLLLYQDIF